MSQNKTPSPSTGTRKPTHPAPASTSKPASSTRARPSAKNAPPAASESDEDSSELSTSSEEPSDESSDDSDDADSSDNDVDNSAQNGNDVVNVRANRGRKPIMKLNKNELGPDIRVFLKEFLPQLKAANDELAAQKKAGTLKSIDAMEGVEGVQGAAEVDEDKDYIEMDLGLGVLEVKDDRESGASDDEMDTEEGGKERDVLGKLMGREKTGKANVVQEMDTQSS